MNAAVAASILRYRQRQPAVDQRHLQRGDLVLGLLEGEAAVHELGFGREIALLQRVVRCLQRPERLRRPPVY